MAQADLSELRRRVLDIVGRSPVSPSLKDVSITANGYDDTADFLDVAIELEALDDVPDEILLRLIVDIENELIPIDQRFPSVRFPAIAAV